MFRFSPNPNRANLINWYEWGDAAFEAARAQNKPVMLFLSAFWCRYCQRMDEEAFSETENIALLRAYFVPIRAENGQRPDLDVRYNQNGWPTIVFMTPDGAPILATNYLDGAQFQEIVLQVYMDWQRQGAAGASGTVPVAPADPVEQAVAPVPDEARLAALTDAIMAHADLVNGGYGAGQKFIQPEVNDFLLARYEATGRAEYLDHVRLTLGRIDDSATHDRTAGGVFRTSTGPGWDQPHREKLLGEQAGLIANCLGCFSLTRDATCLRFAEDIVGYLDAKLWDDDAGVFYGCEDFLRVDEADAARRDDYFTIIDRSVYTDACAAAVIAYLDAADLLDKPPCRERALRALNYLLIKNHGADGGVHHYSLDGVVHLRAWLADQAALGRALLRSHGATGDPKYLDSARRLADSILAGHRNPAGGYYDTAAAGQAYLKIRLTLIEQNGPAADFFLALSQVANEPRYREAALWALRPFAEDAPSYGIYAAAYGRALGKFLATSDPIPPAVAGEDRGGG